MFNSIKKGLFVSCVLTCTAILVTAQRGADNYGRWEGGLPLKPTRVIEFETDEGTDISLDVSPDGRMIVFELLGDLYILPIEGGEAQRITSGIAIDSIPRFSPDGKTIAFASDRSGMANVWIVNTDGTGIRQVSRFDKLLDPASPRDFQSIAWASGGRSIIGFTRANWVANGESHFLRINVESGAITDLTPDMRETRQGGAVNPEGTTVWYGRVRGSEPGIVLSQREVATGRTETFRMRETSWETAEAPTVSPDGRWLAYRRAVKIGRQRSELRLHDLSGGSTDFDSDIVLTDEADAPELSHPYNSPEPLFAFTPDSRAIVYASFGKIKRLDIKSKNVSDIPFRAKVRAELGPFLQNPSWEFTGPIKVKQLRSVNSTADGRTIVFSAIGKIWKQENGARPKRLTTSDRREYDPVLSPDGKWVAFVTWSFTEGGKLWKMPTAGGEPVALAAHTEEAYSTPRWTPTGSQLVALRARMSELSNEGSGGAKPTLVRIATEGAGEQEIASLSWLNYYSALPTLSVSGDGGRVYYFEEGGRDDPGIFIGSVGIRGADKYRHLKIIRISNVKSYSGVTAAISPDAKWVVIQDLYDINVVPFPPTTGTGRELPVLLLRGPARNRNQDARPITADGGAEPRWSADGKWLSWSWANKYFRIPYEEIVSGTGPIRPQVITIDMTVPRHNPKGHLLLTNARIVTMAESGSPTYKDYKGTPMPTNPRVIERGDVLLEGSRIKAVGPSGTLKVPPATKTVDLAGKTVVPGYFALHEHPNANGALVPEQSSHRAAYLASGFSTTQNPGLHYSSWYGEEMMDAGEMVGARSVGALVGTYSEAIPNYAAAEAIVRKSKSAGAYLIKEYEQGHRVQRQWINIAAAKHGLRVVCHPFKSNVFDGCTEVAHSLAGTPHRDIEELARRAGTTVELTNIASSNDQPNEINAAYLLSQAKKGFFPPQHRFGIGSVEKSLINISAPSLQQPGGLTVRQRYELNRQRDAVRSGWSRSVGIDAHHYAFNHFYVWDLVHPEGLTNAEALRTLTINGARALGFNKDLGSIEPGKIADLVILNSNPLDDIKSTLDIKYVVKSGEVYDLNEEFAVLWPVRRNLVRFPWMPIRGGQINGKAGSGNVVR